MISWELDSGTVSQEQGRGEPIVDPHMDDQVADPRAGEATARSETSP